MQTALQIITRALRECRVLGSDGTAEGQDAVNALQALNDLKNHLDGYGAAYPWVERTVDQGVTIHRDDPAARCFVDTSGGSITIVLPKDPRDGARFQPIDMSGTFDTNACVIDPQGKLFGATVNGSGNPTGGSRVSVSLTTESQRTAYIWRADLAAWIIDADLTLTSPMPYPDEFDRSWWGMLGMEIIGGFGLQPSASMINAANNGYARLSARYVQPLPQAIDGALLTNRSYSVDPDTGLPPAFWS